MFQKKKLGAVVKVECVEHITTQSAAHTGSWMMVSENNMLGIIKLENNKSQAWLWDLKSGTM